MGYKIQAKGSPDERTLSFEGTLDQAALADLTARCELERKHGARVHVRLRTDSRVEPGVLSTLARLAGISLSAEAPFLARWISRCVDGSRSPSR